MVDKVQLVLTSVNATGMMGSGVNGLANGAGVQQGFGFYEWVLSGRGGIDATGVIPNSSETLNNALALQLFSTLGNNTSTGVPFIANAVAAHSSGMLRAVPGLSEPGVQVGSDLEFGRTWLQQAGRCADSSFSSRISVTDRGLIVRGDGEKGREEGSYECGVGSVSRQ